MRKEYDFGKMKGQKNPYIKGLKTQVTIRLDKETVEYFKGLGAVEKRSSAVLRFIHRRCGVYTTTPHSS